MKELECEAPTPEWTSYEVSTKGLDEDMNTYGSDPWGSEGYFGIRIPQNTVGPNATLGADRYMILLAAASFQANEEVELVSARQFLSIGYNTVTSGDSDEIAHPLLEKEVTSTAWHFQAGGNVSYHIFRLGPTQFNNFSTIISHVQESEAYFWSQNPAILSQAFLVDGYVPPWNGIPPSQVAVAPDLLNFYDLRFPWGGSRLRRDIGAFFEGPCTIAFVATVRQPNYDQGKLPVIPSGQLPYVAPEDAFIATAMSDDESASEDVKYCRIAGSLYFKRRLKTSPYAVDDVCRTCGKSTPLPPDHPARGGDGGGGKEGPPSPSPDPSPPPPEK